MSIRRTFSNSIDLVVMNEYDKGDVDFKNIWTRLPCCLLKASLQGDFLGFYITMFPVAVISEIEKL